MSIKHTITALAVSTLAVNAAVVDTSWIGLSGGDGAGTQQDFHGAVTALAPTNALQITRSSDSAVTTAEFENGAFASTDTSLIAMQQGGFLSSKGLGIGDYILQDGSGGNIHAALSPQSLNVDSLVGTGTIGFSYSVDLTFGTTAYGADSTIDFDFLVDGASVNFQTIAATGGSSIVSFDVTGLDASVTHTAEVVMVISGTGAFNNESEWLTAQGNLEVVPEPSSAALLGESGFFL